MTAGSSSATGVFLGTATIVPSGSVLTVLSLASSLASSSRFNSGSTSAVGAPLGIAITVPSGNLATTFSWDFSARSTSLSYSACKSANLACSSRCADNKFSRADCAVLSSSFTWANLASALAWASWAFARATGASKYACKVSANSLASLTSASFSVRSLVTCLFKLLSLVSWSSSLAEAMSRACDAIVLAVLADLSASWAFSRANFLSARLAEKFATASLAWASRFLAFSRAMFAKRRLFSATWAWSGVAIASARTFSASVFKLSALA